MSLRACSAKPGTDGGRTGVPGDVGEREGKRPYAPTVRNQTKVTTFLVQVVLKRWFLVFDFGLYARSTRCPVLTLRMLLPGLDADVLGSMPSLGYGPTRLLWY
eukprot:1000657-Rhodomonas_salina.1